MARRAQGRKSKRGERSSLLPWLALAAAAHLGLLFVALTAKRGPASHATAADAVIDPIWLELIAPDSSGAADSDAASRAEAATPPGAVAPETRSVPQRAARRAAPEPSSEAQAARARASAASDAPEGLAVPGVLEGPAVPAVEGTGAAPSGSGPQLSLRDLGVDRARNPFIGSVSELPTERQLLNQRLRQSLRSDIAKQDQARGLGPEGPAVMAVTDIVMASATAPNTSALLRVRTDGAGAVTLVDVLDADRDNDEWKRIASALVRALAGKRLRVPAGTNGVSFQLRVTSRVQLPSGADPGVGIDLFGIPLKKGDGARSTKISILSPMIKEIEVPDSDGLRVPVVAFSLIGVAGDLADIGAVARRLVSAYLVSMETHSLPESAPPAAPPAPAPAAAP